jgi:selenide,water dikinase
LIPGGLKNNRDFIGDCVAFAQNVPEDIRALLFDPQTSGGLLSAIAPEAAEIALKSLQCHGINAVRIGRVLRKTSPMLSVI